MAFALACCGGAGVMMSSSPVFASEPVPYEEHALESTLGVPASLPDETIPETTALGAAATMPGDLSTPTTVTPTTVTPEIMPLTTMIPAVSMPTLIDSPASVEPPLIPLDEGTAPASSPAEATPTSTTMVILAPAEAAPTTSPTPSPLDVTLPATGASTNVMLALGALALLAGVSMIACSRRAV